VGARQLTHSYGEYANITLLLVYGFILTDRADDRLDVWLSFTGAGPSPDTKVGGERCASS
jgi:hypothetical protein